MNLLTETNKQFQFRLQYISINHISTAPYRRNYRGAGHVREWLDQGRYLARQWPGVDLASCWSQVQRPNHYTTEPHSKQTPHKHILLDRGDSFKVHIKTLLFWQCCFTVTVSPFIAIVSLYDVLSPKLSDDSLQGLIWHSFAMCICWTVLAHVPLVMF